MTGYCRRKVKYVISAFVICCNLFIGLAGGIAVGGGLVAFFIVLDIIPRLAQLTRSYDKVHWFEGAIVCGALYWTFADFWDWKLWSMWLTPFLSTGIGLFDGVITGLLAAALTEVLNVLPILAKRLRIVQYMFGLLMAMILGKVTGSLFDWLVYH